MTHMRASKQASANHKVHCTTTAILHYQCTATESQYMAQLRCAVRLYLSQTRSQHPHLYRTVPYLTQTKEPTSIRI